MNRISEQATPRGNRHLFEACKKMAAAWFPVNPDHLAKIQDGLRHGAYDLDIDFLITEIQSDISLYTYALREARKNNPANHKLVSPETLLRETGLKTLGDILQKTPDQISTFQLESAEEHQKLRLKDAIVSASTAEVLAEHRNLSGNLGFSTEIIRQLGLTLISWNYPDAYKRAMAAYYEGADLEVELTKQLGFSAGLFGVAIARQWGLCPELRIAVGDQSLQQKEERITNTAGTLEKICEVGEALARANNPTIHPSAEKDWKQAKRKIEHILGAQGLGKIEQHIKDQCEHYTDIAPEVFENASVLTPEKITFSETNDLFLANKHIRHCPTEAQKILKAIYDQFTPDKSARQKFIATLTEQVFPLAGFSYGCIFLLQPDSMMLTPRLTVGKLPLKSFKSYHALSMATRQSDPITAAYHCNTPIVQGGQTLTSKGEVSISSILGKQQRVGVLYLEPDKSLLEREDGSALQRFKALNQALHDCLSLR